MKRFKDILAERQQTLNEAVIAIGKYLNKLNTMAPKDQQTTSSLDAPDPDRQAYQDAVNKLPPDQQTKVNQIHDNLKQYLQTGNANFRSKAKALGMGNYPAV